jgi:hypothetical protein
MGLFDLLFGSGTTDDWYTAGDPGRAQASADYQASAGGWFEPAPPPALGQFDTDQHGGWW